MDGFEILIVDDQPRTRSSLRALLTVWAHATAIREAANGRQAVKRVEECRPDLVLMDVRMPEMDGLEATRLIKSRWPTVKIVVVSMYPEYLAGAIDAGADVFVGKCETPDRLLDVLSALVIERPV